MADDGGPGAGRPFRNLKQRFEGSGGAGDDDGLGSWRSEIGHWVGLDAKQQAASVAGVRRVSQSGACGATLGEHLLRELKAISSPLIRDVRGKGLWVGVDFDRGRVSARAIAERLLVRGILTKETHQTVIRLAPPLVIGREDLDWAIAQFRAVVREAEGG